MLRTTVSRIRLIICALGCAILGASLFSWAQSLQAAGDRYAWVSINAPSAPPLETAEVWQVSANCVRPYFVRALLRSKAKLRAYYALAPEAVRARLDRPISLPTSPEPQGWYHLVNDDPSGRRRDTPDKEYIAQLHVEYAEWYANVFKLEIEANKWQRRLIDVTDQRLILSESTRNSFGAYSDRETKLARSKDDFEDHVLTTLGLGGFPSDEEQALKSDCVKIDLVKKVFRDPDYAGQLWRWPADQTAAFVFGLELILISIFLVPVTLWIGTGDVQVARRHIGDTAKGLAARVNRLAARVRDFDWGKFFSEMLERARPGLMRMRVFLMDLGSAVNQHVRHLLRMAASPNFTTNPMRWGDGETSGKPSATSPPHPSPEARRPW